MQTANKSRWTASPGVKWLREVTDRNHEDKTSRGLTNCIISYIRHIGGYAVEIDTNGRYVPELGKYVKGRTDPGTADIHACIHGKHLSIEVKAGNDRMRPAQFETADKVKAAGGFYIVVRRFEDFYQWLERRRRR